MRLFFSCILVAGLALPASVTFPVNAVLAGGDGSGIFNGSCAELDGVSQLSVAYVNLQSGDTVWFNPEVFLADNVLELYRAIGTSFTAPSDGTFEFLPVVDPFTATCTPALTDPTTQNLPNRTLWQTSQHRDDTQQQGVSGAVRQAFSGQPSGSGGATENSLNFVTSFAALSGQEPAAIASMNAIGW
jgi:hypothetical protein